MYPQRPLCSPLPAHMPSGQVFRSVSAILGVIGRLHRALWLRRFSAGSPPCLPPVLQVFLCSLLAACLLATPPTCPRGHRVTGTWQGPGLTLFAGVDMAWDNTGQVFENVCELDLIFHTDKVHHILVMTCTHTMPWGHSALRSAPSLAARRDALTPSSTRHSAERIASKVVACEGYI